MKKITVLLLSAIMVLFSFSSCRQAETPNTSNSALTAEIDQLKQQIASQAQLIEKLLAQKENDVTTKDPADTENEKEDDTDTNSSESLEFTYITENNGITITKYTGSQTNVRIPEQIDGLPVLKIGKEAFADTKVKNVTLPSVCEAIDWFAFYGCYALSGIYLSEATTSIGYGAFEGCSKSLTIYCPSDSYAQKYAKSFGIAYSSLN